ncbi:uroporphyrinogen decarboxylase family protein [bacterium]|nr:uroporphyrinogen decarboxylase family protein [bacterium]
MTKKQKLISLIAGTAQPDSVLFHPILMHFAARFHGTTYSRFAADYRELVESNIACLEYFDHDAVSVISDPYRETSAFGAQVTYPEDSVPLCTRRIVTTMDDVKALGNPDVFKSERTLDRIRGVAYYRERLGDDIPVIGWIEGPLAEACDLTGDSRILLNTLLEPDFVRLLMDKCLVTAKDFARAQIEAGADVMGVGDAICSQISPSMYEELVLPLHRELFGYIHSLGAHVKLHICGNITNHLQKLREAGADIIDIDWMVDFGTAHDMLGDSAVVCGNLDPVSIIQNRTAPEVFERSRGLIADEEGKKFILSGGCEITVGTPVENLTAMRQASR